MMSFLEMSVTGGILVAVIVAVRAVFINRLPKNVFLVLWGVALCRLLLPFSLPSPTSVYTAAQYAGVTVRRPGALLSQTGGQMAAGGQTVPAALVVWAVAALACALVFLAGHLRARRRYLVSLPVEDSFIKDYLERHRLRRPVQARYSDQITAPLTYGMLWPVILLPKDLDWSDETRLSFILAHEMVHIRRFDALWKWVLAAALCLHWFNPLVWVMYVLSNRDLELSCDESVVRSHGREARAPYALTLVGLEEKRAHFSPLASSFSKNAMEERITAIMKLKKTTIVGIAAALVLVVAVTTVFATTAPGGAPASPSPSPAATSPSGAVVSQTDKFGNLTADFRDKFKDYDGGQEPHYTQEQYDRVVAAFQFEGWQNMSIAEFNRRVNSVMSNSEAFLKDQSYEDTLQYAYETVLMGLPDSDPNAAFLRNTVQASLKEYQARYQEVTSGKRNDPSFSGQALRHQEEDVYGDSVRTFELTADYEFTYRILKQDTITVAERDAFLQAVMRGAQDYLDGKTPGEFADDKAGEENFKAALDAAGKAASNSKIEYTGSNIDYYGLY